MQRNYNFSKTANRDSVRLSPINLIIFWLSIDIVITLPRRMGLLWIDQLNTVLK
jgi:hypothetical protein